MVFFSVFVFSMWLPFFALLVLSVSCLGNAASRKENYHSVNHTQKHGREVFTSKIIAFEPIRKGPETTVLTTRITFQVMSKLVAT